MRRPATDQEIAAAEWSGEWDRYVVETDDGWRVLAAGDEKGCRKLGSGHRRCPNPAVAELNRTYPWSKRDSWWAYCPEHMYGRWVEGDEVVWCVPFGMLLAHGESSGGTGE